MRWPGLVSCIILNDRNRTGRQARDTYNMIRIPTLLIPQRRPVFLRVHPPRLQPEARIIHTRKTGHDYHAFNPRNRRRSLDDRPRTRNGRVEELILELAGAGVVVERGGEVKG